jgi:predicted O-methyltransferase YrrM
MFDRFRGALHSLAIQKRPAIVWQKRGEEAWLPNALLPTLPKAPRKLRIEYLAWQTNRMGAQLLHEVYGQKDAVRRPSEVRSESYAGDLFAWLAVNRRPSVIVEFGSAFGVSGMYWLTGLEAAGTGHLYSFEINPAWAALANDNMAAISSRFTLTVGTFEEHVDRILEDKPIDIAFVDGIHTMEFIVSQFEVLLAGVSKKAILVFDDIDFPTGRMREGWNDIWQRTEVTAACEVNGHLGIVELA